MLKKIKSKLLDCTLRDGSYENNFGFTKNDTFQICKSLERAGVEFIEVGHGLGLGASKRTKFRAVEEDKAYLDAAKKALKKSKWGVFCIPGISSLEDLREYPIGRHTCNKRSSKKLLIQDFPNINFDDIKDIDYLWKSEKGEEISSLEKRIENIKKYIQKRSEKTICIVSHTIFLEKMKDNKISLMENGKSEIDHCFPYTMEL